MRMSLSVVLDEVQQNCVDALLKLEKVISIKLAGVEFDIESLNVQIDHPKEWNIVTDLTGSIPVSYRPSVISVQAYGTNKKEKEIREAKEIVRIKQKEFKEAQRKLSELTGENK